ncbi:MAG: hypothetical protein JJE09_06025 [Bacteroidia bacterium]|nr:hypothetical protein [Bacteroidia bacterium]
MLSKFIFALIFIFTFIRCTTFLTDPQKIIDKSIEAAGGDKYLNSIIEFDFRNRHYITKRNGGKFSYERIFKDPLGTIHDIVSNKGHVREINGMMEVLPDSMSVKYTSSTNSVIYFALLPYGLNDASVRKKYLGDTMIENQIFYKVEITFGEEGGGEDYEDVFHYWINRDDFTIGYMAYSFIEDDEASLRFRKAINPRKVDGIQFYDYINYKPKSNMLKIEELELLFSKGELEELSKIELLNIVVK